MNSAKVGAYSQKEMYYNGMFLVYFISIVCIENGKKWCYLHGCAGRWKLLRGGGCRQDKKKKYGCAAGTTIIYKKYK